MTLAHGISGILFALAWFVFFDGLIIAKNSPHHYEFVQWLPGILCLLGFFIMMFVQPSALSSDDSGGGFDGDDTNKHKSLFFFGCLFCLASLSVSIWQMSATYNTSGGSVEWPGVALLGNSVLLMASACAFFMARYHKQDDFGSMY